ncbi:hypothetical protein DFH08DRAFT_1076678 [Mycena albidolilacea]|uniref:Uncharacterized protein n=1 Tax=Mycena albidolilacea TaxID=1033008 RepID=A0AAD7ADE2_9AGAR|nr:hypothetical protein DFH08DRAFT_1076678 [Mycena albidolilacea]
MAGRRSRFEAAKRYFELPESERTRIDEEVELSLDFESLSESTITRRENAKEEIEAFYAAQGHSGDVWVKAPNKLTAIIKTWLTAKVEGTRPTAPRSRAGATHVAFSTLKDWRMSVVRIISKYVPDGQKKLNNGIFVALYNHQGFLTAKHDLQLLEERKQFIGRHEIRLMTESMYANCIDLEWTIQIDLALKLMFQTGVRVGALAASTQQYLQEGRYLKWKNLICNLGANGEPHLDIGFTALKCYNGPLVAKRHEANLRPAQCPENVILEPGPPLLLLAIKRGIIKGIKTLDQLFNSKTRVLEWEDWALNEAVFLKGKVGGAAGCQPGSVMRAVGLASAVQVVGRKIGLAMQTYDMRRNYGDEIEENYGEAGAKMGMGHTANSTTYKNKYGRESANLDNAGSVMHEDIVDRYALNQFRAPALLPHVGLSSNTIDGLMHLHDSVSTESTQLSLKRKADALIVPYGQPQIRPITKISDAECRAHPSWFAFISLPESISRQQEMTRLKSIYQPALDSVDPSPATRTAESRLRAGFPDQPQFIVAYEEWKRVRDRVNSSESRKLKSIRDAIAAERAVPTTSNASKAGPEPEDADTYMARQTRIEQFKGPSLLVDIARLHAGPSGSKVPASHAAVDGAVPIDDLMEVEFTPLEEGDPDVDEVPAWVVRTGYMRMMWTSAKDMHSRCSKCKVDPTVDQADKEKVWTPWNLARHEEQFHSVGMQLARWYNKHATCLLCALDDCPEKLARRTYTRHINPAVGYHVGDPRLPQVEEFFVAFPDTFLSDEELDAEEERWAMEFADVTLPSSFLEVSRVEAALAGAVMLGVHEESVEPVVVDHKAALASYKRLKISKEAFVYVTESSRR